jgi:ribonuclease P protein component
VLPRVNRMHSQADFQRAVRRGPHASRPTMVVHAVQGDEGPARVGLVVSKSVGNAVTRNRVKRRLRSAVRPQLTQLETLLVVIRAKPAAADADFARLADDLDRCLASPALAGARC